MRVRAATIVVIVSFGEWGDERGLNPRPPEPQSGALPLSYRRHADANNTSASVTIRLDLSRYRN